MFEPNLSPFGELQFLEPNLPKKHFRVEHQDEPNLRLIYFK